MKKKREKEIGQFFCFVFNFSKFPQKSCQRGRRLLHQRPRSVFEEDEAEEAAESSSSKCWVGYTYFVQLNWLWKVELSSQPISEYCNRTTTLIPFFQAIDHFCHFIPSYFIERFAFLIDYTSYHQIAKKIATFWMRICLLWISPGA